MNKATYGLMGSAVLLFIAIVCRLDSRFFTFSSNRKLIEDEVLAICSQTKASRVKFESMYAVVVDPKQYVIVDPALVVKAAQAESAPVVEMDSLRVSGLMRSGGSLVAIVNGSSVVPGDSVRGCEVVEVDDDGVVFLIDGKTVRVKKNAEIQFKMVKTGILTLERVMLEEGRNVALINGRSYKTGDWIDGEIQVKAVSPIVVMLSVRGEMKKLRLGESL